MIDEPDADESLPISHERRDFVAAYARNMWLDPRSERPSVKLTTAMMLCAGSTFLALATGVVVHFLSPEPEAAAATAPSPRATATWTRVAGWDCRASATSGFTASGRNDLWYPVAEGGWADDGCMGTFVALPIASHAAARSNDGSSAMTWWFRPGKQFDSCELAVWEPRATRPRDAADAAATYTVHQARNGPTMSVSTVDQRERAGSWVGLGRFPSSDGGVSVQLSNAGITTVPDGMLGAAQVRARCSSRP